MNRLKLLATATLMALTFTACDEGTPPPVEPPPPPTPVGTISGTVTIEGTAASGITATLSSGATTTTGSGGSFAFSGVEAGTYTVTISGFPEDATFAQVTQSATIATDGQNVQLNFAGEYIRSSSVVGNIVAADAMMSGGDGQPETLVGVTVTLGGEHAMGETMETGEDGGFMFTGLRAGTYTVTISDFPEDVSFETVSVEVEVEVGEVGSADFTGHFIRTSAVEGQVVIEGEGLAGVTVTLSGGPADESYTLLTDADGMYRFEELRPGDYTVSISDFDTRDYEFAATSQDVSVDLDETGTVSFTGVLLRTSGISGRVSVEGMGLGDIEVTLAGGDESRTATTDAGGQYSFAGLAAGDYTVSIAVESDAYVFESMSADVTLGDDESAIQNFEGAHARTASVSGMVFLDEAAKNDMYDEGEHPLAHAGIPVALVGPGVNEQRLGVTDATGAFSFTELQAGPYQLVVLIDATVAAALAANDVAYGGPGSGYSIALRVGEAAAQNVPFDITHTTVNFTVSLRHGDETGDALSGATVTLEGADGATVGSGETGEDGAVTLKVRRDRTAGNMVKAGVAIEGYDVAEGMTDVSWDPQMFATAAGNANDIVNLNVDATVSGATISTDYGGGDALKGWAIGVMHGENAVEGAPEMLDDNGMAAFETAVEKGDLPATFTFAVAEDQDDELDGGEAYEGSAVEYTHTGLSLAGTMDVGTIEVAYSTQTLKVYVHQERDQVMGYTGNVLGGDVRDGNGDAQMVNLTVRYIDDSGRSRSFTKAMWDAAKMTEYSAGVHTFSGLPADKNVVVQAAKAADASIKLLDPDELAAYTGMDVNGITGGAFGAMGGFSSMVELCPLQATAPQDHDECASFAYVTTHTVEGLIWKNGVMRKGDDFEEMDPTFVPEQTVSITPVEGENLAGEMASHTTTEKAVKGPGETSAGNEVLDETHQFRFEGTASGVYTLGVPDGWRARTDADAADLMGIKGADGMVGDALDPLLGDVLLDVTPATATLYGRVKGTDGFGLADVTVTANGVSATTDAGGRYIIEGIPTASHKRSGESRAMPDRIKVDASVSGNNPASSIEDYAGDNTVTRHDIDLTAVTMTASVSGTVRASGTNAPVAGVEIMIDGAAPTNAATSGKNKGKLVTGADGTYTAEFEAQDLGATVEVSVKKAGMSFVPGVIQAPAHAGSAATGFDFTGFVHASVTGRVRAPGGGPLSGVEVKATATTTDATEYADTTGMNGGFAISVPYGSYTITASKGNYTFNIPAAHATTAVAPGQSVNIGTIEGMTAGALNVRAARVRNEDADDGGFDESQSWGTTISVMYTADPENMPEGFAAPTYTVQTNTGTAGAWTDATATAVQEDGEDVPGSFTIPTPAAADGGDGEFMVRVVTSADETTASTPPAPYADTSATATVAAIDPSASGVTAARGATDADPPVDTLGVSWSAVTNTNSTFRVVIQVSASNLGDANVWFVASGATAIANDVREWRLEMPAADTPVSWTSVDGTAVNVTRADLEKALTVAVESLQGTFDADDNPWTRSTTVSVAAKPDS